MRFTIVNNQNESIENIMRAGQYRFLGLSPNDNKLNLVRPLSGRDGYPRFHVYLQYNQETKEAVVDLHLDQRKTVYERSVSHHGDYDSQVVQEEAARIKTFFQTGEN